MEREELQRHSSSFGAAATTYAEHRPDYVPAAVRWALEPAPGARVLDLGAGTGKLTTTPDALGADVIAVEPDSAMLSQLRHALPTVRAVRGSAEAISQDRHRPRFGSPQHAEFPHGQRRTADSLVETLATKAAATRRAG